MSGPDPARARGWVAHLREGGTTPWSVWAGESGQADEAGESGGSSPTTAGLPGAQQLELLRRLNLTGRPGPDLARRVLEASAPGRGSPDLELTGAADPSDFGPRPVDPAALAAEELIRVAAGLIAEDLVAQGAPEPSPPHPLKRRLAPAYRLVGDPWVSPMVRDDLRRQGWMPGGRDARVLLVVADVETLVVNAWTARCFAEGAPPWRAWLDPFVRSERCPPRADLVAVARRHAAPEIVHDVALLPRLLRRGRLLSPTVRSVPRPGAAATEAARRIGGTLDLLVLPEERAALLSRALLPRLAGASAPALRLPARAGAWAQDQEARMRRELERAGHHVHGQPAPRTTAPDAVTAPDDDAVLDLMLDLLLHAGSGVGG